MDFTELSDLAIRPTILQTHWMKGAISWAMPIALACCVASFAHAQSDKTDDDKPADPDTCESTVEERTLGLLPQPLQRHGVKFAATYIGEVLGNTTGA